MFRTGRRHRRCGTTVVETAFVLPVFLFLVLSLIEFAHAQMLKNVLNSACRTAARLGSTEGNSTSSVEDRVRTILGGAIDEDAVDVYVRNASQFDSADPPDTDGASLEALPAIELTDAEPRQLFLVRAKVAYNDVALVPMPFLQGIVLEAQAFMRHE